MRSQERQHDYDPQTDFFCCPPIQMKGGYVKEQSVSIFGGAPLPWTISKPAGVEWDNKRKIELQKGLKRPGTNRPMTEAVRRRVEKEAAEERKKQAKLAAQLKSEGKKGLFGLW